MSYTMLARKYRSRDFDEVVGQDHVARTLKRAIESGRVAHAFLFTGTRGTGKTSTARILAKALNCEKSDGPTTKPCGQCESCRAIARGDDIDVIEIDAASNTGVDNVRDIIENSAYRPARSRFKVYIIDEVHMLSKAAFNALLKTLEEPPEHVKFILATTEVEKVLQTILSRCQRYDFRNIPTREIAGHLADIVKQEGIEADPDALMLVAKAGAGSMRDSLSLLDRLLSVGEKRVTVEMIEQLLGLPKAQLMFDLAQAIGTGDVKSTLEQTAAMITRGLSSDALVASLVDHLRNLLILRTCGPESELVEVPGLSLKDLAAQANRFDPVSLTQDITILEELRRFMRQSQSGRALLDATLVRLALAEQFTPIPELLARVGAGAAGGDGQKKKSGEVVRETDGGMGRGGEGESAVVSAFRAPPAVVNAAPATPFSRDQEGELQATPQASAPAPIAPTAPVVPQTVDPPPVVATAAPASPERIGAAPVVAPPQALTFDEEEDDLPRPGKVWDSSGPSLSELLAQQSGGTPALTPVKPADAFVNVEPVAPQGVDVSAAWASVMSAVKDQPGLYGLLTNAKLAAVRDQQAVITIAKGFEGMLKMLEAPQRREAVTEHVSAALGRRVGVKFEIDQTAAAAEVPVIGGGGGGPNRNAPPPAARRAPERAAPVAPPEPAGPPAIKITPELLEEMKKDPLVAAVMDKLGGTAVKVEEAP